MTPPSGYPVGRGQSGPSLGEAQRLVDDWMAGHGGYYSELTNLTRLFEECGELARIYARTRGEIPTKPDDDVSPEALASELGDILFLLLCLSNQAGVDLGASLESTLRKYSARRGVPDEL